LCNSLGVGAKPQLAQDGLPKKSESSELAKLRKRLLGKKAAIHSSTSISNISPTNSRKEALKGTTIRRTKVEESEDEEESRVEAISRLKIANKVSKVENEDHLGNEGVKDGENPPPSLDDRDGDIQALQAPSDMSSKPKRSAKRKPSSFLDEVLAGKARSKEKRKKKQLDDT
jgi:hypothetical protein